MSCDGLHEQPFQMFLLLRTKSIFVLFLKAIICVHNIHIYIYVFEGAGKSTGSRRVRSNSVRRVRSGEITFQQGFGRVGSLFKANEDQLICPSGQGKRRVY